MLKKLLSDLWFFPEKFTELGTRYLIAHHHTYTNIDGIDYQILVRERISFVNMWEGETV